MPTEGQVPAAVGTGSFPARRGRVFSHRHVGTLYLALAVLAGLTGGALALPLQLAQAGQGAASGGGLARAAIDHGALMVLFCALPALTGGFGTWFVPMLLGAPDMASRRASLLAWIGLAVSFLLVLSGVQVGLGMLLWCAAMLGWSINMAATVLNMRRPGMDLRAMPLFAWAQALTALMMVVTLPVLAASLTRGLLAGAPHGAGQAVPALRAFSGPEIGLLLLPAAGIVCQLVETFSGVALRRRAAALGAMAVLSVGGATIWVHDLFSGGLAAQPAARPVIEQAATGLPMLVLLAVWGATVRAGRPVLRVPMLWACAFAALLLAGPALAWLGGVPAGHAVALPAALFATFGGFYYWIGKMTGHQCPESGGRLHVALATAGTLLCLAPHRPACVLAGVILLGLSMLAFVMTAGLALRGGARVRAANYWGPGARTLEWTLATPAPRDAFADFPYHGAGA
ncbi:cbb3-type cytochrome c oxidase subunit I [Nguyenibacter sp. L1]|uniref:cbb3-type cytochrome c oxidase subunit I n=1 Tax=Nguyenibacter sp. L1 TaxID=3049350 RepID=UPI002B4A1091|nr:cbb3-type cytochrome c oxidase subunit I [Nguyenibacter sp. L1]WRH88357.1 cbb3-type cytochrome c oxidase subunit I [Nguyenibacter sp. L1]